jgi:diaminobutyrate-2-oxoglutarate transaminase
MDFSRYHLAERASVRGPVPGERSRALLARQEEVEGSIVSYPRAMPLAIRRARGAVIEDADGNLFLDFMASAGVVNLGHCNPDLLERVHSQANELVHALDFPTETKLDAIDSILDHLPPELRPRFKVAFVGPTGADAVDAAVKLAKMKTGRDTVVAFTGAYHGISTGTVALTSNVRYRMTRSSIANVHFAPFPYCYRCPMGKAPESCGIDCFDRLREMVENSHSGVELPAAIILEPIQGEGGCIPTPDGYLERVIELAQKHGIVVIFDEIQAGFFRSGRFLSFLHGKAVPDVITLSKGIGGVGLPLAGLLYKREIEAWRSGDHIGTFRGNALALAACKAAFDFADKHQVAAHVEELGRYLTDELQRALGHSAHVGEIRGKGLMIGIEVVRDRESREPFAELVAAVRRECFKHGLLFEVGGHYANVIRLIPPLVVTRPIADDAVSILAGAFRRLENPESAAWEAGAR